MPKNVKDWQAPIFEYPDNSKLAWVKEAIETGTSWVHKNVSADDISRGISVLAGNDKSSFTYTWNTLTSTRLKRDVKEIIESLADIRPFWGYQTNNRAFTSEADMMNKVTRSLYLENFVDRSLRDALQFSALTGGGFISPYYARSMYGRGKGQFYFEALGQPDVLPVQLPRNRDYQEAYVVTLSRVMPVAKAHALFPMFQSKLKPFARTPYGQADAFRVNSRADRWKLMGYDANFMEQFSEIFYTYVLDLRMNESGEVIPMGQPGSSWYYEVPSYGTEITRWNSELGRMATKIANEDDCRLYPFRRLMISCAEALMYDGPNFDWHGMVPLCPFYIDDWAWEPTGYSLMKGALPIHDALTDMERAMQRAAMGRVNPSKQYTTDNMSPSAQMDSRSLETIDPFRDIGTNIAVEDNAKGPVLMPTAPQWMYETPDATFKWVEYLENALDHGLGLDQIAALSKLKSNIDDPEKALEAAGPVVTGTSRSMEQSLRTLGEMMKYNVVQYMNTPQIMQYVGVEGVASGTFDYDPDSLVPSHAPGEDIAQPSALNKQSRALIFVENLKFMVTPHSLHEIAQAKNRLNLLALLGRSNQVPIDPETVATAFNIPNYGTLDGSTVLEKMISFLKLQVEQKVDLAKLQQGLMMPTPLDDGGGDEGGGAPANPDESLQGVEGLSGGPNDVGRPPTAKKMPKVSQKGTKSGGRVVVKES